MNPNYILLAIPFFFLSIGWELWVSWRKNKHFYQFDDALTNLNIGIGSQAVGILTKVGILSVFEWIYTNWSIIQLPINHPLTWVVCFIAFDFIYYWAHRWGHEWNIFWGAHIVHHQSQQYNLSVALRQSWFHNLLAFVLFIPLPLLGFHPYVLIAVAGFITLYQYWIHTKAITRLPRWIEYIFNTPSHHRVHHATNPQYLDKNYAATFIIWDRIFGTFAQEKEIPTYGITTPLNSWDPIWANVHFYKELYDGSKKESTIWAKFALIFKGPEYLGKLLGIQSKPHYSVPVYTTPVSRAMKLYVTFQFVVLAAGLFKYLMHFDELSLLFKLSCFALIILTTQTCSGILERKPWVNTLEIIRLACGIVCLNILYYYNYQDWFMYMLIGSIIAGLVSVSWFISQWILKPSTVRF